MDEATLLSFCTFGFVGCVAYFLTTLLSRTDDEKKLSTRLNANDASTGNARGPAQPVVAATPMLTRLGQAAAKPFMPTQRDKISSTRRNLGFAGIYSAGAVKTLYGFKFILLIVGFVVGYAGGALTGSPMLCLPAGALIGLFAPVLWLKQAIKANQRALEYGLADALDLMVVCVEAGLTVDSAMQRVGQELSIVHPILSRELGITHMETRVGVSRIESLRNMGVRTGSLALQSLASMLGQAERFGTSVGQALRVHAETLRLARQNKAEEVAAKTTVKMTFPLVLFIFPATFLVLIGPTAIHLANSPLFKQEYDMFNAIPLKTFIFAAAVLAAAGCQPQPQVDHGDVFAPDDQPKAIDRLLWAQYARGARNDATLYAVHFDGPNLNSLGMAKLDAMLRDESALPLAVWMSVPDDDKSAFRRAAVTTYLKDKGLSRQQIAFNQGANPDISGPAARGITDLSKTDSDSSGGSAGGGSSGGASSSSSSGAGGASH